MSSNENMNIVSMADQVKSSLRDKGYYSKSKINTPKLDPKTNGMVIVARKEHAGKWYDCRIGFEIIGDTMPEDKKQLYLNDKAAGKQFMDLLGPAYAKHYFGEKVMTIGWKTDDGIVYEAVVSLNNAKLLEKLIKILGRPDPAINMVDK